MAKTIADLKQERASLVTEMRSLYSAAEAEGRSALNEAESTKFTDLDTRAKAAGAEIERRDRMAHYDGLAAGNGRKSDPLPHDTEKRHSYSVLKAMRQSLEAREGKGHLDGLELEVHQELEKRRNTDSSGSKREVSGVLIPLNVLAKRSLSASGRRRRMEARTLDTTAGVGSIPTILSGSMIDLLRKRTVVLKAGATLLTGMQGLFAIPRQNAAATASWVAEGAAPGSQTNGTIDQVAFSPKTLSAWTEYTRRFMLQTSIDAEQFARNDLNAVIARGIDLGALNGTGASNDPTGLLQMSSIPKVIMGTNGLAPTWAKIVEHESAVAIANADAGKLGYVTSAKVRGKLKTTVKDSNTAAIYLMPENGQINSYPTFISNQVPDNLTKGTSTGVCSAMIFGNWEDLVIATWSGVDILVDPYSSSTKGSIRITAFQDADVQVRHLESFSVCTDLLAA